MGLALWWLNDIRAAHHQRTLAYQQYKKNRESGRAAMLAMWLAREQIFLDGNPNAMRGWFARAERLLWNDTDTVEYAWLELLRASLIAPPESLEQIAQLSIERAHRFHDDDLEAAALAFSGIARVNRGRIQPGMQDLDEAMVAATSGEISFQWVSEIFCLMLSACDLAGDLERTEQWCRSAREYAEQKAFPFLAATCRTIYGSLLTATGKWDDAESQLLQAIESFERGHVALRVQAIIKLADLRVWQGRLEEAEVLLTGFQDHGSACLPLARMALTRGEPEQARAILNQVLAPLSALTLDKAPLLRLLVDVQLALGDFDAASATAGLLEELAQEAASTLLIAQAELAQGQVLRFRGSPDAETYIYAALAHLRAYDQSLLAARARFEMAHLTHDSDRPASITWARAALACFERLGAKHEAAQAANFLRQLGTAPVRRSSPAPGQLTPREQEVLDLISKGLTNREIAQRLVVSPKTVEHHVSQILSKLGAHTRTEAAALLVRQK